MGVTAKLKVVLFANNVKVVESEDAALWQAVLAHVNSGGAVPVPDSSEHSRSAPDAKLVDRALSGGGVVNDTNSSVARLATRLDVTVDELRAACAPSEEPPFIHLDGEYWEAFRENTPQRGRTSVSPIQLAATLLTLWLAESGMDHATQAQAQAVLRTIQLRDTNPSRGIRNCSWLQFRNGGIHINPARTSRAHRIARAYCTQKPVDWGSSR